MLYTCFLFTIVFGIGSIIQWLFGHFTIRDLTETYINKKVMFEYFLVAFFTALNGLFLVFASPPERCPAFLQSALTNTMIPLVIFARILILRKTPTCIQTLCALGVVIGLIATSLPTIFDPTASQKSQSHGVWKILWPLIFAFSLLPAAIYTVLEEKYLQRDLNPDSSTYKKSVYDSDNPIPMSVFLFLVSALQTISFIFLFWYDLIPTIGYAHSVPQLLDNFAQSFRFTIGLDGAGPTTVIFTWLFVINYCTTSYGQGLLLRYTEGAIYSSMVAGLVTPIGEIFWMLFEIDTLNNLIWNPQFKLSSLYAIAGLLIIAPCVVIYNIYGEKSFEDKLDQERMSAKQQLLANKSLNSKKVNIDVNRFSKNHRNVSAANEADMSLRSEYDGSPKVSTPLDTPNRFG